MGYRNIFTLIINWERVNQSVNGRNGRDKLNGVICHEYTKTVYQTTKFYTYSKLEAFADDKLNATEPFLNRQILDFSKLKEFADGNFKLNLNVESCLNG